MTRYICVISGKGGVGKTTTAINLAYAFHKYGKENILVDGNLTTPNIGIYIDAPLKNNTLHDVIKNKKKIDETIHTHTTGIKLIPGSISVNDLQNIDNRKMKDALHDLKGKTDVVIIDTAAGLGSEAIMPLEACDEVLIVANPELASVTEALKTAHIARKLNKTTLGIVLTKSRNGKEDMGDQEIETFLELPIIAKIPYDTNVKKAAKIKKPVLHSHPKSKASKEYFNLAKQLLGESYAKQLEGEETKGLYHYVLKKLGLV